MGGNQVTVNRLPMDLRAEIRKGLAQTVIQDPHAILVWSGIRLRGVVDEVVGKQFFEQLEIAVPWTSSVLRRTTDLAASFSCSL
jgi:hypothetical protein